MKRQPLDLTDAELYRLSLALASYINNRDTWLSKSGARITNNLIKKVCNNGLTRKKPEDVISPIYDFEELEITNH